MKQGYRLMGILGVLLIYELFVQCVHQPIILPSLISVFEAAYEIVSDPMFTVTVLSTVRRTVLTFTGVLIISLLLGILAGYFKALRLFLAPFITLLRTLPTISITIILLIWFGAERGPVMIMACVIFPLLYEMIESSMNHIDSDLLDVCLLFGATPYEKFRALYYPQLMRELSGGVQATIGLSFKVMVMGEVMAQTSIGIGRQLNYEKTYLNMPAVFAWSFVLILLVMCFEFITQILIKELIRHLDS